MVHDNVWTLELADDSVWIMELTDDNVWTLEMANDNVWIMEMAVDNVWTLELACGRPLGMVRPLGSQKYSHSIFGGSSVLNSSR